MENIIEMTLKLYFKGYSYKEAFEAAKKRKCLAGKS